MFADQQWRIAAGIYNVMIGSSAANIGGQATVSLAARSWPAAHTR
jgi:hypothetical protein